MDSDLSVALVKGAEKMIYNDNLVIMMDSSEEILQAYKVSNTGTLAQITKEQALKAMNIESMKGWGAALAGKGFMLADIGKFAGTYAGNAAIVLTVVDNAITVFKGIRDNDGKMIVKAVLGTAFGVGGAIVGASIGTALCPGVGTVVGGGLGALVGGVTNMFVDEVII